MGQKNILLSTPTMHGEEQIYIQQAFASNLIAPLGPNVDALQDKIVSYVGGSSYATVLSSGTAALHLANVLAGVKQESIVFAPSLTFAASVNPSVYEKAIPVFIDSERDTWNMSPEALEKAFEKYPHPTAVIAVHLYGTPSKIDEIRTICNEHRVPLIEDAAESMGSMLNGEMTGTFGDFGIFSFNGNKIITTSGGGALLSAQKEHSC